MSRRARTHVVTVSQDDSMYCGTIGRDQLLKMDRAARRDEEIDRNHRRNAGSGPHGGTDREQRKRTRLQGRNQMREAMRTGNWDELD